MLWKHYLSEGFVTAPGQTLENQTQYNEERDPNAPAVYPESVIDGNQENQFGSELFLYKFCNQGVFWINPIYLGFSFSRAIFLNIYVYI